MMKIQCSVCEAAEANVLCVADEAALCWACDERIHAANKLASKHQRVPLSTSSSHMPKCDICQDSVGYFFCLEDRALLCRKCDVAIHTANTFVAGHRRFLLTGVRVGLEPTEPGASSSFSKFSGEKMSQTNSCPVSRRETPMPLDGEHNKAFQKSEASAHPLSRRETSIPLAGEYERVLPVQAGGFHNFAPSKVSFTEGSMNGSIPQFWNIDEFIGLNELIQNFDCTGYESSKADISKLGDSDCSGFKVAEDELDDECFGLVPNSSCRVPQVPSPPTTSGLYWLKNSYSSLDRTAFVPDICDNHVQDAINCGNLAERRKKF